MAADRFVGRRAELAVLRDRLDAARAGSGRVVVVAGPAGIGKTRLVEELAAAADRMSVGWGSALSDAGMPPLWSLTRAVRGFTGLRAAVGAVVTGNPIEVGGSADDVAAATFAADTRVLEALEAESADRGLLLVLDDLQWADQATVRLLGRLAAEVRRIPVLVLATHRDPTSPTLVGLLAQSGAELLRLEPLTNQDARDLLAASVDGIDPEVARSAIEQAGGSPLYLRTLAQVAGAQLRGAAPWGAMATAPELQQLVAAALRTGGPRVREAVAAASVLGLHPPAGLVAGMLGDVSAAEVIELLRPGVPAGLVEISPGQEAVRFAHALVRDAVYASLTRGQLAALHRRAAELLEPGAVGRDDRAAEIADHWRRSGRTDRAVAWAVRAADAAGAAGAYDQAADHLSMALDAAHELEVDRGELLLDLARIQYLGGRLPESLVSCRQAAAVGESREQPVLVARAAVIIQGMGHPAINADLATLCRRALRQLSADAPTGLVARVEAQLACALSGLGEVDEAELWAGLAMEHAGDSGDQEAELDAIRARAEVAWGPGSALEMLDLGSRAIELAEALDRPLVQLWARVWRSDGAVQRADMVLARQEIERIRALADRTGLSLVRWHWLRRVSTLAGLTGDFDRCREAAAEAARVADGWQDDSIRGTHLGLLVLLAHLRGNPADLPPWWGDFVLRVPARVPIAQAVIASASWLAGRQEESMAIYRRLLGQVGSLRGADAAVLSHLSDIATAAVDADGCRRIRPVVAEIHRLSPVTGTGTAFYKGSSARWLGELDIACGDPAAAIVHLEEGLAVDAGIGARPYVVVGRIALARACLAVGPVDRAIALARAAAAEARRLDMPGRVGDADRVLADALAAERAADPLTVREHEIADLVAQALSNREIAARLFLSERTVESHIRNILLKTGLRSRTDLTRWVLGRARG